MTFLVTFIDTFIFIGAYEHMQALFGKAFGVYFLQKGEGREEEIGLKSRHNVEVNGW